MMLPKQTVVTILVILARFSIADELKRNEDEWWKNNEIERVERQALQEGQIVQLNQFEDQDEGHTLAQVINDKARPEFISISTNQIRPDQPFQKPSVSGSHEISPSTQLRPEGDDILLIAVNEKDEQPNVLNVPNIEQQKDIIDEEETPTYSIHPFGSGQTS
ncbi:hypothetical protein BLA29_004086, partial [Euroglyphus maynei]